MDDRRYSYAFVRRDISLPAQVVQTGHACLEAGNKFQQPANEPTFLVVLQVPDQEALLMAVERIQAQGIDVAVFYEPDFDMGYTAACTQPVDDRFRYVFRKYHLWNN